MYTINAALSLDDIGLLRAGLSAAASAHRGPKNPLALKMESKRNALDAELQALQGNLLAEMTGTPAESKPAPAAKGKKATTAG